MERINKETPPQTLGKFEQLPLTLQEILDPHKIEGLAVLDYDSGKYTASVVTPEGHAARKEHNVSASPQARFYIDALNHELSGESLERIRERFRDRIVLDIGAGSGMDMTDTTGGYEIAKLLEARSYVAIEPYYAQTLAYSVWHKKAKNPEPFTIPFVVVQEDGLTFLERVRGDSASIITSATDSFMLRDSHYVKKLEEQVAKVVGKQNAFLGLDTAIHPNEFLQSGDLSWGESYANSDYARRTAFWYK